MMDILFVRPADDSAAIQVAAWGQAVRQMAGKFQIDDLAGAQSTRPAVDKRLASFRHLFWFGHGTETKLVANGQALIDAGNIGNLGGGMVVAIACDAAVTLGQSAGQTSGFKAFLGFDDELGFPTRAPLPMMLAVTNGLRCLFNQAHNIACAADQLRKGFEAARIEYKQNGANYGLSPAEIRTAWLFAKSNLHSIRTYGNSSMVL